ncbi:MAG: hypothetical protein AAFN11_15460 [Chloroflexota bacterium]
MQKLINGKRFLIVNGIFLAILLGMIALGIDSLWLWGTMIAVWFVVDWVFSYR